MQFVMVSLEALRVNWGLILDSVQIATGWKGGKLARSGERNVFRIWKTENCVRVHMPASCCVGIRLILWHTVAHGARVRSSGEVTIETFGKDLCVVAMTIWVQVPAAGHITCRAVTKGLVVLPFGNLNVCCPIRFSTVGTIDNYASLCRPCSSSSLRYRCIIGDEFARVPVLDPNW